MRTVYVAGAGLTPVGEHWGTSLRSLALEAIQAARHSAPGVQPQALFVGNMLAPQLSGQAHLGALLADFSGMRGLEAATLEAAGASGGAAVRQAMLAVASGQMEAALAVGVEKMTDRVGPGTLAAAATAADADWEASQGLAPAGLAALVLRRYMHEFGVRLEDLAGFSVNAHANGSHNPNAMYRNLLTAEAFVKADMVAEPINLFDTAPDADGAAAILLTAQPTEVRVAASAMATDRLALHDRDDMLVFEAARLATARALRQAGLEADEIDLFELHDAYTVFAALSLEAAGYAERGQGWKLAQTGEINLTGRRPISTFGGLKARGNPGGATGVYQAVEVYWQLRGLAGQNQVPNARWGMLQCLGGAGASAVTHIFERL